MPTQQETRRIDETLRSVESSLTAAGGQIIHDLPTRNAYERQVRRGVADIAERFKRGAIPTVEAAAREASEFRNVSLDALRLKTSPLGLQIAKNLKDQGKTFNDLIARYAIDAHGPNVDFNRLSTTQQNAIFAKVLEKAGTPNAGVTAMLRRLQPAARGAVFIGVAFSIYSIATAENKGQAIAREGVSLGASIAGGALGGAAAGLMCGPGAPACVAVGAFVGGAAAAFGVEFAFSFK